MQQKRSEPIASADIWEDEEPARARSSGWIIATVLLILGAGTLLGVGLYRYLNSQEADNGGEMPIAKAGNTKFPEPGLPDKEPIPAPPVVPEEPAKKDAASEEKERSVVPAPKEPVSTPTKPVGPPPLDADPPKEKPAVKKDETPPPPTKDPSPAAKVKELPPKEEIRVPAKTDASLKKDERPAPPPLKKERPKADDPFASIANGLKSKKAEERLKTIERIVDLGDDGRQAASALCQIIVGDPVPAVRQSALAALEKVHPEVYKPVVALLVEADWTKNRDAARSLVSLGDEGRAALPVVLAHIKVTATKFPEVVPDLLAEDIQALGSIGPKEAAAQRMIVDMTKFIFQHRAREVGHPVRGAAIHVLGDIVQKHPDQAKNITPNLIAALRGMLDADIRGQAQVVLGSVAENHEDLRNQIVSGLTPFVRLGEVNAITGIGKCGAAAQSAIPSLKQLKLHPNEAVRTAANDALRRVDEASTTASVSEPKTPTRPKEKSTPIELPPSSAKDVADLPAELQAIVAKLRNGTNDERIKAAGQLADLGERALPAARFVCEAAMASSEKVSRSALSALEKVHPDLHEPVFILLVDSKASNHLRAITRLSLLAEQAKPAVPVLFHRIKRCQEQLVGRSSGWEETTLANVTIELMKALPKIAPEDPQVVKGMGELSKMALQNPILVDSSGFSARTTTPFRRDAVFLLGVLAEGNAEHRKQAIPLLVPLLKDASQRTKDAGEGQVLGAMQEVELIGNALMKCGDEAKQALTKEVLPRLRDLQFHRSDRVRRIAEELKKKIEDAP